MDDFNQAVWLAPKSAQAYYKRGTAHQMLGNLDQAIADYSAAIRLDPKDGKAYHWRGAMYKNRGETGKADEDFARAKELGHAP